MRITPTLNHGKPRWRVNIQKGSYRKRLFFESGQEALAFCQATGGRITLAQGRERHGLQHVGQVLRRLNLG